MRLDGTGSGSEIFRNYDNSTDTYATFNPFTAVLAALSLLQRPIKVVNLKSLMPFSPSHEHTKGLLSKCTVWEIYLLQDHQIYCLQACMCALFSPEILRAGAVKGLMCVCHDQYKRQHNQPCFDDSLYTQALTGIQNKGGEGRGFIHLVHVYSASVCYML